MIEYWVTSSARTVNTCGSNLMDSHPLKFQSSKTANENLIQKNIPLGFIFTVRTWPNKVVSLLVKIRICTFQKIHETFVAHRPRKSRSQDHHKDKLSKSFSGSLDAPTGKAKRRETLNIILRVRCHQFSFVIHIFLNIHCPWHGWSTLLGFRSSLETIFPIFQPAEAK